MRRPSVCHTCFIREVRGCSGSGFTGRVIRANLFGMSKSICSDGIWDCAWFMRDITVIQPRDVRYSCGERQGKCAELTLCVGHVYWCLGCPRLFLVSSTYVTLMYHVYPTYHSVMWASYVYCTVWCVDSAWFICYLSVERSYLLRHLCVSFLRIYHCFCRVCGRIYKVCTWTMRVSSVFSVWTCLYILALCFMRSICCWLDKYLNDHQRIIN